MEGSFKHKFAKKPEVIDGNMKALEVALKEVKKIILIITRRLEMSIGGNIYKAGNAKEFKTGDWRSICPKYIPEKCKQCGLCFPVCPEDAIPVNKEGKREDFNFDYCKGCGICAKVCPFGAIEMIKEGK